MWADMWEEMEKSNVHPKAEKPQPAPFSGGRTVQDHYYDYFDSENSPELIQEDRVQNPIYPNSVGDDQDNPKPAWVNEALLKEIKSLKARLFKVENAMARLGQGKKHDPNKVHDMFDKSMFSEIRSLRDRIEKVSSLLGIEDEPTPYDAAGAVRQSGDLKGGWRSKHVRKPSNNSSWADGQ